MKTVIKTDVAQKIADVQKEALSEGSKNINQAVKNVNKELNSQSKTKSKETSMKTKVNSYFKTLAANNPKLAKAVKAFKSGSVYLVKNYVASVFGIAILPAIVVGGACVVGLMKYKGGKYLTNKKAVYGVSGATVAVAVASVVTIVAAGAVTGLLVAAAVTTAICVAVDTWSWFKNRKAK